MKKKKDNSSSSCHSNLLGTYPGKAKTRFQTLMKLINLKHILQVREQFQNGKLG